MNYYCDGSQTYITLTIDPTASYPQPSGAFKVVTNSVNNCTWSGTFTIPQGAWGCANGKWSGPGTNNEPMTAQCLVPSGAPSAGEKTTWEEWVEGNGEFAVKLNYPVINGSQDSNYNWAGRVVQESFSNFGPYFAACNPALVAPDPNSAALVGNTYYDQLGFNGYTLWEMGQIRVGGVPCGSTATQTISIDCQSSSPQYSQYEQHSDIWQVEAETVHVERSGVPDQMDAYYGMTAEQVLSVSPGLDWWVDRLIRKQF